MKWSLFLAFTLILSSSPAPATGGPGPQYEAEARSLSSCTEITDSLEDKAALSRQIDRCTEALPKIKDPAKRIKLLVYSAIYKRQAGDLAGAIADADRAVANPAMRSANLDWWHGAQLQRCLARAEASTELDKARDICGQLLAEVPWDMEVMMADAYLSLQRGEWWRAHKEYGFLAHIKVAPERNRYAANLAAAAHHYSTGQSAESLVAELKKAEYAAAKAEFDSLGLGLETIKARATKSKYDRSPREDTMRSTAAGRDCPI